MNDIPDLYVSLAADIPDEVASDLVEEAKGCGFHAVLERREPEFFAVMEWLIPSAVMLFLGRKFIDTFAEEAAKDIYPIVKAALIRVIRRTSGPGRVVKSSYISSAPYKVPPGPVTALTVLIVGSGGFQVRFRFPADLPESDHTIALEGLLAIARQIQSIPFEAPTGDSPRPPTIVLTFDSAAAAWKPVDSSADAGTTDEHLQQHE